MSTELNAAISRAWYLDLFYDNNLSLADDIHTAGYTNHDPYAPPGGFDQGPQAARRVVTLYRTAFPDLFFTIEDQVAEDDRVATRWTARGTHSGMLNRMPPTGNTAVVGGITFERYGNSKLAEFHVSFDMLGLLMQLGIIPTPYVALVARRMRARCNTAPRSARGSIPFRTIEEQPMYGTIARVTARPDALDALRALAAQTALAPGQIARYVFRLDNAPHNYMLIALFESREAYYANAASPEQHARYLELRALLTADPEWHDGDIVDSQVRRAAGPGMRTDLTP